MEEYKVSYSIEVLADNYEHAAIKAKDDFTRKFLLTQFTIAKVTNSEGFSKFITVGSLEN